METAPTANRKREKETTQNCMQNTKGKKRQKQQKQLEYATRWKTLIIIMQNGLRTLNIAILNPDSMREKKRNAK